MMMTWRYIKYPISLFVLVSLLTGCESDYTRLVKSELAKGIRYDSILLGIKFGQTRYEFYGRCEALNKDHLIMQGANNSIQYVISDAPVHTPSSRITILFVPAFDEKEILTNMDMKLSYPGWAPWNRDLQSDSLKERVMRLLMIWYGGNEFVLAKVGDDKIPVKLDGNRRIQILVNDPQYILVKVQDILHPKFKHVFDESLNIGSSK